MRIKIICITILCICYSVISLSQNNIDIPFEVKVNYPPLSISQDQLHNANSLEDLNRMFKSAWIKEYHSVEISSVQNNKVVSVKGNSDVLNQEQKDFLQQLVFPAPITVSIHYIPQNKLKNNPPRKESFTFQIHPPKNATFLAGEAKLKEYLKSNAIDKIPVGIFKEYDLAVVTFTINENGQVVDASVFQSTKDEAIDNLLYETVCNMPDWSPALHANGKEVRQEFAFTVGNHESCVINLINTEDSWKKLGF